MYNKAQELLASEQEDARYEGSEILVITETDEPSISAFAKAGC